MADGGVITGSSVDTITSMCYYQSLSYSLKFWMESQFETYFKKLQEMSLGIKFNSDIWNRRRQIRRANKDSVGVSANQQKMYQDDNIHTHTALNTV
ncbi:hypothetical protein Pmani_028817 [Petrolisthes manimaculis]|uniref:Uncharacterized protein n=1 Tax=Petrolisthes manimaculis TaxID=1843537 RepID=A0AAE1TV89_9EUCA|nr:hypothetical protein Pmani_028817 [Petrolisthes manimaculis]